MKEDSEYLEAVGYLHNWQQGGTSFACMFFTLLAKADYGNRNKLRIAFPAWVEVFEDWQRAPEGAFFQKHLGKE